MVMRYVFPVSGLLSSNLLLSCVGIPRLPIIRTVAYRNIRVRVMKLRMNKKREENHGHGNVSKSHPRGGAVDKFQQVLHSASNGTQIVYLLKIDGFSDFC